MSMTLRVRKMHDIFGSEMDKVTQQNAANAEESASASEELGAQAGQMIRYPGGIKGKYIRKI